MTAGGKERVPDLVGTYQAVPGSVALQARNCSVGLQSRTDSDRKKPQQHSGTEIITG